ncbi:NUDIX hydrolase [Streptococcus sp. DD13]|uniref:NUDIX hydrolase n=1 Tax=Streptococcus sp. DD13 TaxID=1777881 RepID=UPI000793A2B8|nr:CoA pyrophosphatase [Streptococcus sp. DD13]KXT77961.1 putative nudix hydrolase YeaB [Streptococcus sp. DD13]
MTSLKEIFQDYQPQALHPTTEYAVFLPLLWIDQKWHLLYEVRSDWISQPGEVSFPGGKIEAGESPAQAALRETVEELRLNEEVLELWGELDYWEFEGRKIHAFVGELKLHQLKDLHPNQEVKRIFSVSLSDLIQHPPVYYELRFFVDQQSAFPFERIRGGEKYPFRLQSRQIPFYEDLAEPIWGLTAQFTERLVQLINEKN